MTDQSDAQTPSAQQQHQPPSLPNSPHPKRVRTDDLLNPVGTTPSTGATNTTTTTTLTLPTMSAPHQDNLQDAHVSTPTPTSTSTLPPVSSLLPGMNTLPPAAAAVATATANGHMSIPLPANLSAPVPAPAPIPPLMVQKLNEDATAPTRGSAYAAGYDLYASAGLTLQAKSKGLVSTGIAIACPAGTYGRVAPRSGLASKHFLDTGAGVIDADYRGEVKVLMFNFSDVDYEIKKGERVAQLVLERIVTPDVVVVEKLDDSVRGAGGFGSTGYI